MEEEMSKGTRSLCPLNCVSFIIRLINKKFCLSKGTRSHCPSPRGTYPWLLYSHGEGYTDHTFCTLPSSSSKYVAASCPISKYMQRKKVISCCHGWLILYSNIDRANVHVFSLWNPVTLESIHLPPLEWSQDTLMFEYLVLSSPPSNPDSTLVLFVDAEYESSSRSILFCGLHDSKWTEMQYGKIIGETDYLSSPVSYNGKIYATTVNEGKLVVIEMVKPNYELTIRLLDCQIPFPRLPFSNPTYDYLVESCGELFVILFLFQGLNGKEIIAMDVLKLDFSTMIWKRVKSAKDRVFFLSLGMGIPVVSCSVLGSTTEGGGGYIHFIYNESLYSYNIDDKSINLSFPCPDLPSPCCPRFWVMPESNRISDDGEATKHKNVEEEREGKIEELVEVIREKGCNIDGRKNMTECQLFSLPFDILKLIAEQSTFLADYLNFRVTCKFIRSAVPPIKWRSASAAKLRQTRSLSPWLILSNKDKGLMTFIDPKLGDRYFKSIPELLGDATICSSKGGWLLMRTDESSMVFFNPFTNTIIQLPKLPTNTIPMPAIPILSFSFSYLPTSSDCLVVGISGPRYEGEVGKVYFTRPGESEWDYIELGDDIPFHPYHNSPIFYDLQFYFLGRNEKLGWFGFEEEEEGWVWDVFDDLKSPCNFFHQNFLVDCGVDFLLAVFVGEFGKWVQVFNFNRHTRVWEEIKSLGDHMIFISGSASFSAVAEIPGMENKIYFPRLFGQNIIFYSLDTCKYHTFGSKEPLMDFYSTSEPLLCGWIEPRWFDDDNKY